jgi:hypothetical protein
MRRLLAGGVVVLAAAGCGLESARNSGWEASAIASVRTVSSAQFTYAAMCGGSYAPTLPALLEKGYLTADLGSSEQPVKMGYRFRMTAAAGDGVPTCGDVHYKDFEVRAEPEPGVQGLRYFRASSTGEVFAATRPDFSDATKLQ